MRNFEWLNALIWTVIIAYYFLDLSSLLNVSVENKDNKVIVNVDKKPEKIKEDKDTIKSDW